MCCTVLRSRWWPSGCKKVTEMNWCFPYAALPFYGDSASTARSSYLRVGEGGLEFRLGHTQLVLPVPRITQHIRVDAERDVVDERSSVDPPDIHAPLVVIGSEGIEG